MNRKIPFAIGEYYHLYNRGVERRQIFMDPADYRRFIALLHICNTGQAVDFRHLRRQLDEGRSFAPDRQDHALVDIGAWCLMPNHFHILAREKTENGISAFFRKVLTAYSMYFNKKYAHAGPLFAGRFQARRIDSDPYLKYMYAYIHLNPVKLLQSDWKEAGIHDIEQAKQFLQNYEYSSYQDYCTDGHGENHILNTAAFPDYFSAPGSIQRDMFGWLPVAPKITSL